MYVRQIKVADLLYQFSYRSDSEANSLIIVLEKLRQSILDTEEKNKGFFKKWRDIEFSVEMLGIRYGLLTAMLDYLISVKGYKKVIKDAEKVYIAEFKKNLSDAAGYEINVELRNGLSQELTSLVNRSFRQIKPAMKAGVEAQVTQFFRSKFTTQCLVTSSFLVICKALRQIINNAIQASATVHCDKFFPEDQLDFSASEKISCKGFSRRVTKEQFNTLLLQGKAGTDTHLLLFELATELYSCKNVERKIGWSHSLEQYYDWPFKVVSKTSLNNEITVSTNIYYVNSEFEHQRLDF